MDTEAMKAEEGDFRVINMTHVSPLVQVARRIQLRHGAVMLCMINDAYFDFAASWGCNTAPLDVHRHVLFLTTDVTTGQRLKCLWPEVSVVAMDPPQFSGFRNYSRAGHVRMMTERTRFILRLLEAGVPLLLFEVDCLWLKDPLPFLQPFHAAADIVGTRVNTVKPIVVASGFLLLHPTPTTVQFWRKLTDDLDQLVASFKKLGNTDRVSEADNEQRYFTRLARKQYAGINISYVPDAQFPDGKWYSLPEKKRRESCPVLINNNWVVGKDGKRGRAKAFGHWFWDEAQGKCNATAVNRLFH
ncbi:uncharacterized protein LOC143283864 [Babylonia areolata]|uniref:uncharacterized protein LOC143283864 n=1 Tax=Babylonia areolata TaxID=304850 RepID=UPI003FD5BD86